MKKGMIVEDKLDPAVFRSLETLVFFLCHTNRQLCGLNSKIAFQTLLLDQEAAAYNAWLQVGIN